MNQTINFRGFQLIYFSEAMNTYENVRGTIKTLKPWIYGPYEKQLIILSAKTSYFSDSSKISL